MSDAPINAAQGAPQDPRPIDGLRPDSGKQQPAAKDADGVAFRALLEQLEVRAEELRQTSNGSLEPASLSGAVEQARESLQEALSLGDELLEAYHQRSHQQEPEGDGTDGTQS